MTTSTAKIDVTLLAGGRARVTATFTALGASSPSDPAAVVFKTRHSDATAVTTYTYGTDAALVRSSAGVYYLDLITSDADTDRTYWCRVKGSTPGAFSAVGEVAIKAKGTVLT